MELIRGSTLRALSSDAWMSSEGDQVLYFNIITPLYKRVLQGLKVLASLPPPP